MKNGWVIKILISALFTIAYGAIVTTGHFIIANDKETRSREDQIKCEAIETERRMNKLLADIKETQNEKFTIILVKIAELKGNN